MDQTIHQITANLDTMTQLMLHTTKLLENLRRTTSADPISDAINTAAKTLLVTPTEIRSNLRLRHVVLARWTAWALLDLAGYTSLQIAAPFNCHRSSVSHGLRELTHYLHHAPPSDPHATKIRHLITTPKTP